MTADTGKAVDAGAVELCAWKFFIRNDEWRAIPGKPELQVSGCVAVAIASTEEAARAHLDRYAAENGLDARWLGAARVARIPLVDGAALAWAEV